MTQDKATFAYREAAVRSASQIGLVCMMYDMIIEDLRHAIEALASGDIERRTESVKHALAVLAQLQGTLNMESGGETARNLDAFYSIARAKLLEAHIKCSSETLRSQSILFSELRSAWHQSEQDSTLNVERGIAAAEQVFLPASASAATELPAEGSMREWTA